MTGAQAARVRARAWVALAPFVLGCLAVGWLGGLVTRTSIESWYPMLAKPAWTPPDWAFPVVWTILYAMMGVAGWLAWRAAGPGRRLLPLGLFAVQLLLNAVWTTFFFGLRDPGLALIDIALLLAAIAATILAFRRASAAAAWLLVPYLAWTSYAAALNAAIWRMN